MTMSANGEQEEAAQDTASVKTRKHDNVGVADLEKVTDYAEETEIALQDMSNALAALDERTQKRSKEKAEKEKELAKVIIKKTDVDLIVNEMEITRTEAERSLRENQGDIVQALLQLTN